MSTHWQTVAGHGAQGCNLQVLGDLASIEGALIGFFASSTAPTSLILPTLDVMLAWPNSGPILLSGFQSPLERAALKILLTRKARVVAALAAPLSPSALPREWRLAISGGRLTLLWEDQGCGARASEKSAELRNRLIVRLSRALFVVSGGTSSRAYRMARVGAASGRRLLCHQHPRERDLFLLGGEPLGRHPLQWLESSTAHPSS